MHQLAFSLQPMVLNKKCFLGVGISDLLDLGTVGSASCSRTVAAGVYLGKDEARELLDGHPTLPGRCTEAVDLLDHYN